MPWAWPLCVHICPSGELEPGRPLCPACFRTQLARHLGPSDGSQMFQDGSCILIIGDLWESRKGTCYQGVSSRGQKCKVQTPGWSTFHGLSQPFLSGSTTLKGPQRLPSSLSSPHQIRESHLPWCYNFWCPWLSRA